VGSFRICKEVLVFRVFILNLLTVQAADWKRLENPPSEDATDHRIESAFSIKGIIFALLSGVGTHHILMIEEPFETSSKRFEVEPQSSKYGTYR